MRLPYRSLTLGSQCLHLSQYRSSELRAVTEEVVVVPDSQRR